METNEVLPIKWLEYQGLYVVHCNGQIWSNRKQRFLKISKCYTIYSYPKVVLVSHDRKVKSFFLHTIIAEHFIPKPQLLGKIEVNHIDMDKYNCAVENLEWVTHQSNMLKARQNKKWTPNRSGFTHSESTKQLMAEKKQKKIILYNDNQSITFNSIEDFLTTYNTYRKLFNRYVNSHKTFNGFYIRYL